MRRVRVLVGPIKGAFILTPDEKREQWQIDGPHFGGWEIYHFTGAAANPDVLFVQKH